MQDFQNELGTWLLLLVISEHGNPVHLLLGHLVLSLNFCTGSCSALLFPLIVLYCFFVFLHFCCHVKEMPVFTFDLMHCLLLLFFFQFNEEARSPFVKKFKTIIHPGEVGIDHCFMFIYLFIGMVVLYLYYFAFTIQTHWLTC